MQVRRILRDVGGISFISSIIIRYTNIHDCVLNSVKNVPASENVCPPFIVSTYGHLEPKIPKNLERNRQYENCSHFWDVF